MTKHNMLGAPLGFAMLAGCSGGVSETMQPGQWEMTLNVTEATAPGLSDEMSADLVAELNRELAMDPVCVTQADSENPAPRLFLPAEAEGECDFAGSTVEAGMISISGSCGDGGVLTIEGAYGGTTMEAVLEARIEDGSEMLEFTAEMNGERTGACTG
ncbi:DUF3617 domain-containing protein [Parasphingopyxis marina]|uniref:DUF3617 family protein n=1 Tax=Parasphingopyxis marina TaxID=2761622 RepID=A0A842HWZ7_9SPHN|nr:DUF3617 family protein [Parasphingopyxis marina]MBC2776470.1 DUF3617 family protein [Parasphingopyxis marina]